jgi:hypothetical protein
LTAKDIAYIETETSLLAFKDNQLYTVIDIDRGLHPGSIVYSDECLFIGMRDEGWMYKYDLKTKKLDRI